MEPKLIEFTPSFLEAVMVMVVGRSEAKRPERAAVLVLDV